MNRLFRRNRRKNILHKTNSHGQKLKKPAAGPLQLEHLEPRVMLTTLTLHSTDEFGMGGDSQLLFYYSDPETTEFGDDNISDWNVLTIGTLSGLPP
ncbi:MAG: hypothetical protein JW709_09535, partial [Sedimentisphaerales bacterium]|nr:hypothetical protein [Sedimentisphaerales bacterium]